MKGMKRFAQLSFLVCLLAWPWPVASTPPGTQAGMMGPQAAAEATVAPTDYSNLLAWWDGADAATMYDATSGGSLVAADGAILRWEDKGSGGIDATQASSGSAPIRKAALQNGLDAVRFDGSTWVHPQSLSASTGNFTMFVVANVSAKGYFLDIQTGRLIFSAVTGVYYDGAFRGSEPGTGSWKLYTWVLDSGGATFREDGADTQTSLTYSQKAIGGSAAIGRHNSGTTLGMMTMDLGEMFVYSRALNSTEIGELEGYLATKWGISLD